MPCGFHGPFACRTGRGQFCSALRTEYKNGPAPGAALRAGYQHRVAQHEIQDRPYAVRNKDRQQRPHDVPHASPAGVCIDISDQNHPCEQKQGAPEQETGLDACKTRPLVIESNNHRHPTRNQQRYGPDPARNNAEFAQKILHMIFPSCCRCFTSKPTAKAVASHVTPI